MTKRCVLYARVSSDDTRRDGRNLAGQLEMCREYALKHGWIIVAELAEDDRGASGASLELPQLNQMMEMARNGAIDTVIVREIDRFSRTLAKQLIVEQELKRAGVQIEYVLGEYPGTPEGNLNKNIKAVIAEYERSKITERMTRGRHLKVKAGSIMCHGRPPFGYRSVKENGHERLELDPEEAEIVRMIFTWYTTGDEASDPLSLRAIAGRLTALSVPTFADRRNINTSKRCERGVWSKPTVAKILKNETYAGVWRYGKAKSDRGTDRLNSVDHQTALEVPAVVTREQWMLAQARLKDNRNNKRPMRKYEYLMARRMTCVECSRKIACHSVVAQHNGSRKQRYPYYYCPGQRSDLRNCSMNLSFRADRVDELVWDWVRQFLTDPTTLRDKLDAYREHRLQEQLPRRERLTVINSLLEDNRRQWKQLLDLYLDGSFPRDILLERKLRIETTVVQLEQEHALLSARLEEESLTSDQIMDLEAFAAEVAEGIESAETNFQTRRWIIERLNVVGELAVENGERVVYVECILGEYTFSQLSTKTR